ncbi:N-6 DNA methylase [Mesorhizobium opportunistum]|uniref:site-specific DNA-methyltransferase (adenine-specific) n=1 Tax=Mesorhizobium opportunistum TaxID=593909 RepID=A0ABV1YB80_9HYPH
MKKKSVALEFTALQIEGNLISPAMLSAIDRRTAGNQTEADYGVPKGLTIRDEIARYFRIGQALFEDFAKVEAPSSIATSRFVEQLLNQVFGFSNIARVGSRIEGHRLFAVTLEALAGRVPAIVVPSSDDLDHASESLPTDGRKRSAATAMQDWLNHSDAALWGLISNGEKLRLMRDNQSFTRPTYIEANLRQIFEAEDFASFAATWLLLHASRFGQPSAPVTDCALENWREQGSKQGVVARDRLRDGVETALVVLGTGFLADNSSLRASVTSGELPLQDYFSELLRLVYRLIFLMAAEDRDLLHPPSAPTVARRLYAQGYSLAALRERSIRRSAWDRHLDRWEGLKITFAALDRGEKLLGLPALGGIFARGEVPDLETARLSNKALMEAIYRLAWLKDASSLQPVNWRDMETEELGSVYESLLELTPRLIDDGRAMAFAEGAETKGNQRKTTGSYYTPDSLVQALLDSALDPVLDRIEAEADEPAKALSQVTVIDPACGSGHFLLAAARRIATRLARVRSGGVASASDYRHALRDVARTCIHGVDRNPMAVELTKVALWIETVEPGKPLGFLDANIRCGDALLGLFDLNALKVGIPDGAYRPLTGDDKETAKHFAARNKAEKEGQGSLDFAAGSGNLPTAPPLGRTAEALRALPEDTVEDIERKKQSWAAAERDPRRWSWRIAADLYLAAFLKPKTGGVPQNRVQVTIPTTGHIWQALSGGTVYGQLVARAQDLASAARVFHWPLEFPDVMGRGGFDCVLGNPPWDRIKLQEEEFFASLDPEIAQAANASTRRKMIAALAKAEPDSRERNLHEAFELAKRVSEAASTFVRTPDQEGGRFPLTGRGDVNTYALFAELFSMLAGARGRAGVIVPTGIATDATTAPFFAALIDEKRLASLFSFFEIRKFFVSTDDRNPFCLLTIGREISNAAFAFFLNETAELAEPERRFTLSPEQIAAINPNTKTVPVFRSRVDAELTAKIYARVPVLVDDRKGDEGDPWGVSFARLFDMSNDSGLFRNGVELVTAGVVRDGMDWITPEGTRPAQNVLDLLGGSDASSLELAGGGGKRRTRYVPLYEAKMIHQFDHRWATYDGTGSRDATLIEKRDVNFEPSPRYWVPEEVALTRLAAKGWSRNWSIGWRRNARNADERTMISQPIVSHFGVGDSLFLLNVSSSSRLFSALLANANSLPFDFIVRQKISGSNMSFYFINQFPVIPPSFYTEHELGFVVPRVLELTYTSHSMKPFARDIGFEGPPFAWDEVRRARLRAELDAFYARAYGLTRDELRYVLDPADVKGPDYPSETFRVLKNNEIRKFGEYRTRRLVLEAWDRMEREEVVDVPMRVAAASTPALAPLDISALPDGVWATPVGGSVRDKTLAQIVAVLKALPGPTPVRLARYVALYSLEPRLLTPHLSEARRAEWRRLVGVEAEPRPGIPALGLGGATGWGDAVRLLTATGSLVEDGAAQTWTPGNGLDAYFADSWPQRALFSLNAVTAILENDSAFTPSVEEEAGLEALAA